MRQTSGTWKWGQILPVMVSITESPMRGSPSSASCLSIWASCFFRFCTYDFKAWFVFQWPSAKSKQMDKGKRKKNDVLLDLLWAPSDVVQRLGGLSRGGQPQREGSGRRSVSACRRSPHFRQMLSEEILTFFWGPWPIIGETPRAFFSDSW